MTKEKAYASDLDTKEFEQVSKLIPRKATKRGRPREYSLKDILDAIFYCLRTGCAWRLMPHDFPKWQLVYSYFRRWKKDGTWKQIHDALRGDLREQEGRHREPSAGIIDSQSVKTTEKGGIMDMMPVKKLAVGSGIFSSMFLD